MFGSVDVGLFAFFRYILVGILEKAEFVFCLKYAAYGGINLTYVDQTFVEAFCQGAIEAVSHHVHIGTGFQSQSRYSLQVAQTVFNHLRNGGVVGNYKAVPAPLIAEYIGQQPAVGSGRHAVDGVERGHK